MIEKGLPVKTGQLQRTAERFKRLMHHIESTYAIFEAHKKKAYLPITEEVKMQFSPRSKIGGIPYLRNENDWPVCPNCKRNMDLLVQLNLADLPEKSEEGLLQLFYCTSKETDCSSSLEGYLPFSKASVVRKIRVEGPSAKVRPNLAEVFQEKVISGWEAQFDYPHREEYDVLGIEIPHEGVFDCLYEQKIGNPIRRDKLFGWPNWIQGVSYPYDPKAGTGMQFLFQLASFDHLNYRFGDDGTGHITQSVENSDLLAFGWACH